MWQKPSHTRTRAIADALTVALLVGALSVPLLGWAFDWHVGPELDEQRTLAEVPELGRTPANLRSFPERFGSYFGDHYGFRNLLVRWNSIITVAWLGTSPATSIWSAGPMADPRAGLDILSRHVQMGPEGWFFFFRPSMMDSFRGLTPATPDDLAQWRRIFGLRRRMLRQHGIEYLLVVAPEKQTIYPEKLPSYIRRTANPPRTETILQDLREVADVPVLDLRPPLLEAKRDRVVYYRTGPHWNEFGAYVAYASIMRRLAEVFPGLEPYPLSDFDVREEPGGGRPLLDTVALQGVFSDAWVFMEPRRPRRARRPPAERDHDAGGFGVNSTMVRETALDGAPRVLIFHDSFARTHLDAFLSEHFARTAYSWTPYSQRRVQQERPDLVIEIRAERMFETTRAADHAPTP